MLKHEYLGIIACGLLVGCASTGPEQTGGNGDSSMGNVPAIGSSSAKGSADPGMMEQGDAATSDQEQKAAQEQKGNQGQKGKDGKDQSVDNNGGEDSVSSPFVVGTWKFVSSDGGAPSVDTEFRFINPTDTTLNIEYAFFELDGTFCGCDRDDIEPNATVIYTILDETMSPTPVPTPTIANLFSCKGESGALKSIVFTNKGDKIFLNDAEQVGFQTTAFGGIVEPATSPTSQFLQGTTMTESGLEGVSINDATVREIQALHQQCNTVQGPLAP